MITFTNGLNTVTVPHLNFSWTYFLFGPFVDFFRLGRKGKAVLGILVMLFSGATAAPLYWVYAFFANKRQAKKAVELGYSMYATSELVHKAVEAELGLNVKKVV